jgi:putative transcriptional regulator
MDEKLFDELLAGIQWMGAHMRGEAQTEHAIEFAEPDVKAIRESTRLSRSEFACLMGVTTKTVQNWEQKRVRPTGPARALLKLVSTNPKAAVDALHGSA